MLISAAGDVRNNVTCLCFQPVVGLLLPVCRYASLRHSTTTVSTECYYMPIPRRIEIWQCNTSLAWSSSLIAKQRACQFQDKIVRLISGSSRRDHIITDLKSTLATDMAMLLLQSCPITYKSIAGDGHIEEWLTLGNSVSARGILQSATLVRPHYRTNCGEKALSVAAAIVWNTLTAETRQADTATLLSIQYALHFRTDFQNSGNIKGTIKHSAIT